MLSLVAGLAPGIGTVGLARGLRVEDPSLELFCVCAEPRLAGSVHKHAVQASCAVSVRDPDALLGSSDGVAVGARTVQSDEAAGAVTWDVEVSG